MKAAESRMVSTHYTLFSSIIQALIENEGIVFIGQWVHQLVACVRGLRVVVVEGGPSLKPHRLSRHVNCPRIFQHKSANLSMAMDKHGYGDHSNFIDSPPWVTTRYLQPIRCWPISIATKATVMHSVGRSTHVHANNHAPLLRENG